MHHLLLILSAAATAFAGGDPDTACKKEIARYLTRWESHRVWRRDDLDDAQVFRSPTSRIGVWLEIHRSVTGDLEAIRLSPEGVTIARFDPRKKCAREIAEIPRRYDEARIGEAFSDERLRRIVSDHRRGIIFSWSPHMPLSLKALGDLQTAATKMGMKVFLALDPDADDTAAARAAERARLGDEALRRIESIELFQRGMSVHFPSALIFADGRIRGIIPGAKEEPLYEKLIANELAK